MLAPSILKPALEQPALFIGPRDSLRPKNEPLTDDKLVVSQDLRLNAPLAVNAELTGPPDVIDMHAPDLLARRRDMGRSRALRRVERFIGHEGRRYHRA